MTNDNIRKDFEATKEYKAWQESLLAIIGYISDKKNNNEELAGELMADHLNASLELQKGLERAKYEAGRRFNEDFQGDFRGE
jgi:hypothetical protein